MKDDQPELHPRCKSEEEVEEVSSQDPGWELSSDSTASPVGQSELSLPAHITESKTGFSTVRRQLSDISCKIRQL